MKEKKIESWLFLIITFFLISGCQKLSTGIKGDDNKMNGSFEIVKQNLPVNWYFYSPETVPEGDFDIIIDTTEYKEGKQSLKFQIRECSSIGGVLSPGFFEEFNAVPNETYKISFWIMNKGCDFKIGIIAGLYEGFEKTKLKREGLYKSVDEIILTSRDSIDGWKFTEGWKYDETYIKTSAYAEFIYYALCIMQ